MILAIARGGLLVGAALGYALSVKNVYTMNVEYYTGVDERLEVPRILPPAPDFVDLDDARILIADDVADTGHTLESVHAFCEGKVGEVRVAVLYEKPHTVVPCDYVWRRTDRWIDFPWSAQEPVVSGRTPRGTPDAYGSASRRYASTGASLPLTRSPGGARRPRPSAAGRYVSSPIRTPPPAPSPRAARRC